MELLQACAQFVCQDTAPAQGAGGGFVKGTGLIRPDRVEESTGSGQFPLPRGRTTNFGSYVKRFCFLCEQTHLFKTNDFASHDLQGPIRQVSSYVKLLKQSKTTHFDKKDAQYIKFIEDSCQHMKTLVTDLLEFSKLDNTKSKIDRIDLNSIFDPILLIFDKQIRESRASLKIGRMPQVMCDPVLISQVFTNLISNALKFQEPNSTPKISISANLTGEFVEFVVRDNGLGVPVEDLENVFSIFHRGQRTTHIKGTGIGLAICRKIVNRHGGEIWISKEEKLGTAIHFTLPEVGVLN